MKATLKRYLSRLLWIVLFLLALGFAVKNSEPVTVAYYLGLAWQGPLSLVLLTAFLAGVGTGLAAALGHFFRQKREILSLKKELRNRSAEGAERSA